MTQKAWFITGEEHRIIAGPFATQKEAEDEMIHPHGDESPDYYFQWGTPRIEYGLGDEVTMVLNADELWVIHILYLSGYIIQDAGIQYNNTYVSYFDPTFEGGKGVVGSVLNPREAKFYTTNGEAMIEYLTPTGWGRPMTAFTIEVVKLDAAIKEYDAYN